MTAARDFLAAVLDSVGYIRIVGLRGEGARKIPEAFFFEPGDFDGAAAKVQELSDEGVDAFFSTATLKSNFKGKAQDALSVKVFKIDLDVKPGKDGNYDTFEDALAHLKVVLEAHEIPKPSLLRSGYGLHAYWIGEAGMEPAVAKLFAEKLKRVTEGLGLKCDPVVTADVARIMRVPGTYNYKNPDDPKPVEMLTAVKTTDMEAFKKKLNELYEKHAVSVAKQPKLETTTKFDIPLPAHLRNQPMDDATRNLLRRKRKKFSIILEKSLCGEGCNQIKYAYENKNSIEEPQWRAVLSIARFCEDGETACHDLSKGYEVFDPATNMMKAYSPDETEMKMRPILGPYRCDKFRTSWPKQCEGCKQMVTSPILLGEYVREAPPEELVLGRNEDVDGEEAKPYQIPQYPWPFFRREGGGVCKRLKDGAEGEETDTEASSVFELTHYDIYMVDRLMNEDGTFMAQFRVHHTQEGVRDFVVDGSGINQVDTLKKEFGSRGVVLSEGGWKIMREYVEKWYNQMRANKVAVHMKRQFGWTKDFKSFVLGDREIFPHEPGAKYSATAPSLNNIAKSFTKKGSLDVWRSTYNIYAREGMEASAFCALVGFASPLLAFTDHRGICINAFNEVSGTGKSTTMAAALSIWGDPSVEGLMMHYQDTPNARIIRMGVYQNIPLCIDEVTKMDTDAVVDMLLFCTQGRGKDRAKSSANEIRDNFSTWCAPTMISSNTSYAEQLQADGDSNDGALMRLMEPMIPISDISMEEAVNLFSPLNHNYGHAGEIFAREVLENVDEVKQMINDFRTKLIRDGKMKNAERFWMSMAACIMVGGLISQRAGLHDFDMDRIYKYILRLFNECRARIRNVGTAKKIEKPAEGVAAVLEPTVERNILSEFLNLNAANTFHVLRQSFTIEGKQKHSWQPVNEARVQKLLVRYEHHEDHDEVFVSVNVLSKYMADRNINRSAALERWEKQGLYAGTVVKRLGSGSNSMHQNPERVYHFKLEKQEDD